jgi:hypothetical protein
LSDFFVCPKRHSRIACRLSAPRKELTGGYFYFYPVPFTAVFLNFEQPTNFKNSGGTSNVPISNETDAVPQPLGE